MARKPLSTVVFIYRQRRHSHPLQVFTLYIDRTKRHIANHLTFVVSGDQTQRQEAIFAQVMHQLRFRIAFERAAQQSVDTGRVNGNFNSNQHGSPTEVCLVSGEVFIPASTKSASCSSIMRNAFGICSSSMASIRFFTYSPNSVSPSMTRRRWKKSVSGSCLRAAIINKSLASALKLTSASAF
ncbi:hypothetical protein CKO_04550 [Citrobacter koseri ATCC BAA-895]|uniref:Uncharacterized protein n=1 Tax=Citrobacter koseri (strain ATCC BAA-895 / CDC 4225-83 / SGSC4696) TaxID=290338 RepID=A8AQ42_CITK8|nr:hypothetical protein CKO_04550 [Citrobacter koseri ATCC BAA-895]